MRHHDVISLRCWILVGIILNVLLGLVCPWPSSVAAAGISQQHYDFLPAKGKTLLMLGQDKKTIDEYVTAIGVVPAGVMVYTSIQEVSGLAQPFNNGAGVHHAAYLLQKYPHSSLQIGLYMVNALDGVNQGTYDQNIEKLAVWIRGQQRPVYLRIGYEFDNPENHYDPQKYILAFKRIVDRFRALNVDNVAFVWHSGAYIAGDADPMDWFPGEDYVDWFAVSFFSPAQYEQISRMAGRANLWDKPFMIAESSPMGTFTLKAKKEWYDKFFRIIAKLEPQAVCYINNNWDSLPMWENFKFGDARVEQLPEIKDLWLKEINKPRYVHAR